MVKSIIRTDKWNLNPSPEDRINLQATVDEYRAFCQALSYVILGHWVKLQSFDSKCVAIEKLIHQTKKNPTPKHKYFINRFWKFPSYLRRAAIEFAWGQVSSYLTRYRTWQSVIRKRRNGRTGGYPKAKDLWINRECRLLYLIYGIEKLLMYAKRHEQ